MIQKIENTDLLIFDGIDEKEKMGSAVSKADRDKLLMKFPSEKDRAAAIFDASGADGYIVPYFRQRNTIGEKMESDIC